MHRLCSNEQYELVRFGVCNLDIQTIIKYRRFSKGLSFREYVCHIVDLVPNCPFLMFLLAMRSFILSRLQFGILFLVSMKNAGFKQKS